MLERARTAYVLSKLSANRTFPLVISLKRGSGPFKRSTGPFKHGTSTFNRGPNAFKPGQSAFEPRPSAFKHGPTPLDRVHGFG